MELSTLPYIVFTIAIGILSLFLILNPFLRACLLTFAHLLFEKATDGYFLKQQGFPRLGKDTLKDVTDPAWLSRVLSKKQRGTVVSNCSGETMGSDMGNASTMFRLFLEYDSNPYNLPPTMILKLAKNDMANRIPFTATRMNEMETKFYSSKLNNELLKKGILCAQGYGGDFQTSGGNCYILMEDVTSSDQQATFTTEEQEIKSMDEAIDIVDSLAQFHATLFNREERFQTDLSWIIHNNDSRLCMTKEFFNAAWPSFLKRFGERIPDEVKTQGKLLGDLAQQVHDYMGLKPNTLVHVGKGAIDLGSFIGGSMSSEITGGGIRNNDGEVQLLRSYLSSLEKHCQHPLTYEDSVTKKEKVYDLETLMVDYKMALSLLFVWNVSASLAVPFDTSAASHYDLYCTRLMHALHRTSAINFALWYLSVPGQSLGLNLRGAPLKLDPFDRVAPIQRAIPGRATHVEHHVQLHKTTHSPHKPVGFWNKYINYPFKYYFIHRATASSKGHHGQKTTDIPIEELEGPHPVDFAQGTDLENYAFDSYYISGFSNEVSFALRICRRIRDEESEVWMALKIDGEVYAWPEHPNTVVYCQPNEFGLHDSDFHTIAIKSKDNASMMSFTLVKPMERWLVNIRGLVKHQKTGELLPIKLQCEVTSAMPFFSFGTHVNPELTAQALACETFSKELFAELRAAHQEHYEQFSRVEGDLSLAKKRVQIQAIGMRDRAFGVRQWGYMNRYISSYFYAHDHFFNVTMASLPTLTNGKFGFVSNGSETHSISAMSGVFSELASDGIPAKEWELAFVANGVHYLCIGYATEDDSVGLNMDNGMWVNFRFASFDVYFLDENSELQHWQGLGGSEFGYRFAGYKPVRPKTGQDTIKRTTM